MYNKTIPIALLVATLGALAAHQGGAFAQSTSSGAPVSEATKAARPAADVPRTTPAKPADAARTAPVAAPAAAAPAIAQPAPAEPAKPRAEDATRTRLAKMNVKAITPEELEGFLYGKSMEQARAADLNRFPSPEHVVELADKLGLSKQQRERTQQVLDESQAQAARLGYMLVDKEKELDRLFATGLVTREKLFALLHEIAHMRADIRGQHLEANMAQRLILTPPQLERYMQLRGLAPSPLAGSPVTGAHN